MDALGDEAWTQRVIWIHGPSHSSHISQSIADACARTNIHPVTFFFTKATDEQYALFIPTIAFQLCLLFPEARPFVGKAIDDDPSILSRSPIVQLRDLILLPLTRSLKSHNLQELPLRLVVIVDAMDNCSSAQQQILVEAILTAAKHIMLPITFLIFGKRLSDIQSAVIDNFRPKDANFIIEIAISSTISPPQHGDENAPHSVFSTTKRGFVLILFLLLLVIIIFPYAVYVT